MCNRGPCSQVWRNIYTIFGRPQLHACRNFLKSVLIYKCINGLAPSYLLSEFPAARSTNRLSLYQTTWLPLAKTTKYQVSLRIDEAPAYNSIPSNRKSATDLDTFQAPGYLLNLSNVACLRTFSVLLFVYCFSLYFFYIYVYVFYKTLFKLASC